LFPLAGILVAAASVHGGDPITPPPGPGLPTVDASAVWRDVEELASDTYRGRNGGSPGELAAAALIAMRLEALGLEPLGDDGTFLQSFEFMPRFAPVPGVVASSQNVIALLPGQDPARRHEILLIGAHYDGQGADTEADPGRQESELADSGDRIWNSANDNAVSIAALLEVARLFTTGELTNARSLVFCAFGAEEHGMIGSFRYVERPPLPLERHVAMLNLEQLGRRPGTDLMTAGFGTSALWPAVLARADARTGRSTLLALERPEADTDHFPFFLAGIPAMTIGHGDGERTHTPADEAGTLSFGDLGWRTQFVAVVLAELAADFSKPTPGIDPRGEFAFAGVLASPAEAAAAGLPPGTRVLRLAAGWSGGRGSSSLAEGDLILRLAGEELSPDVLDGDLGVRVRDSPPGECLPLTVVTDGERREECV